MGSWCLLDSDLLLGGWRFQDFRQGAPRLVSDHVHNQLLGPCKTEQARDIQTVLLHTARLPGQQLTGQSTEWPVLCWRLHMYFISILVWVL